VQVRIIAGEDYKLLEFYGTHDEHSHPTEHSKKLKYNQIETIYNSVTIAPKQSATQLRRNLMQAKGSLVLSLRTPSTGGLQSRLVAMESSPHCELTADCSSLRLIIIRWCHLNSMLTEDV
jgi:hypothetical protein